MKNLQDLFDNLLADRGKTHGDWDQQADTAQMLKEVIRAAPNWNFLSRSQKEAMEMECTKTSRTLHGDPQHIDNYVDKVGYLLLVLKEMFKDQEDKKVETAHTATGAIGQARNVRGFNEFARHSHNHSAGLMQDPTIALKDLQAKKEALEKHLELISENISLIQCR